MNKQVMKLNRLIHIGIVAVALALLLSPLQMRAQSNQNGQTKDSVVVRKAAAMDSTLSGKSIFNMLPSKSKGGSADVTVHQSSAIQKAMSTHISSNSSRTMSGYRVRIYFDNQQNSRAVSESTMRRFEALYPGIAAYRNYQAPFFKVTVGDFRTKSEAMELLQAIKGTFPTAFVTKENINYPVIDRYHSYVVDTVKVVRNR